MNFVAELLGASPEGNPSALQKIGVAFNAQFNMAMGVNTLFFRVSYGWQAKDLDPGKIGLYSLH